ncbi:hypothetical protein [Streptomyces sp. NPDC058847]
MRAAHGRYNRTAGADLPTFGHNTTEQLPHSAYVTNMADVRTARENRHR